MCNKEEKDSNNHPKATEGFVVAGTRMEDVELLSSSKPVNKTAKVGVSSDDQKHEPLVIATKNLFGGHNTREHTPVENNLYLKTGAEIPTWAKKLLG